MDFHNNFKSSILFTETNNTRGSMPILTLKLSLRQCCWQMKNINNID